jgi:hypothetical protein
MRGIMRRLLLLFSLIAFPLYAQEDPEELRELIRVYENRAKAADRQASQVLPRDYTSYRFYITIRENNQAIADSLKKKLAEIEGESPDSP